MKPTPFQCDRCGRRFNPSIECCQCDHGRCECGGVLEQIDPRESFRWCAFWMLCGVLAWSALAALMWLAVSL